MVWIYFLLKLTGKTIFKVGANYIFPRLGLVADLTEAIICFSSLDFIGGLINTSLVILEIIPNLSHIENKTPSKFHPFIKEIRQKIIMESEKEAIEFGIKELAKESLNYHKEIVHQTIKHTMNLI
jgi:hypothetical protein